MTLKLELMKLREQSFDEFIIEVNQRLKELDISVNDVQIIANDYRPDIFAIIKYNVRYGSKPSPEIDQIVWKYKKISQEDIDMVSTQCNVSKEKAENALRKACGDLAKAIIDLTEKDTHD